MSPIHNVALIAMSRVWSWSGDLMTCRNCDRSLIASRDGEELLHRSGCKYEKRQHPWQELRGVLTLETETQ